MGDALRRVPHFFMKRIVVTRYGGPETIHVVEEDLPRPKPDEVRVRVLAAGGKIVLVGLG